MENTLTISEFPRRWEKLTDVPEEETRQRIRELRRAKLLPDGRLMRSHPIGDELISFFIISCMAAEKHKDAPEALLSYMRLRCVRGADATPFDGMELHQFIKAGLERARDPLNPWKIIYLQFNTSRPVVEIIIADTRGAQPTGFSLYFSRFDTKQGPIENVRQLSGAVLDGLGRA